MSGRIWKEVRLIMEVDGEIIIHMVLTPDPHEKVRVESVVDEAAWPIWVMGFVCLMPHLVWQHYVEYAAKWEKLPDYIHNLATYSKNWYSRRYDQVVGK